ncbi:unnamed protein product [Lathyrus oleraceus]|uniref:Voltage-gated hydrogen channel 1 n=1 Tax=Pisum sativum TaxID=3888 RepID=A0A9D4Y7E6_PEA|nr:uncharacterized protein LOC127128839 [Pisum sativum]KAI5431596.1 hypothetical protein KIW84_035691 [Pisum sativum]
MATLKSIHVSSTTNQIQVPTNYFSMQTLDSSIQSLIRSWKRRQRWLFLVTTSTQQEYLFNRASWRTQLINFLESTIIRVISISLLVTDLIITILELSSSLISCKQRVNIVEKLCFHWIGIGILSIISMKIIGLLVGLGFSFFKHPGYVVDGVVAIGALIMEGFMERRGGGLLVVVSLWRVIRVVESVFELSDEAIEAQIEGIVCQFEVLRNENVRLLDIIHEKDEIIEKLKEELDKYVVDKERF